MTMVHRRVLGSIGLCVAVALTARGETPVAPAAALCPPAVSPPAAPPESGACANQRLAAYDRLLVVAPHPDDEVLAFAGLIDTYRRQGKPVDVIVVTDGDAYCDACSFWKNASLEGPLCGASDLSNFATKEKDSFAEVRREESTTALAVLGVGPATFLGYPDTGLATAWTNIERGDLQGRLRRSDFSQCPSCGDCSTGYGAGPETALTATTLLDDLTRRLAATSNRTLVATTHWLDGHGDHAALGQLVRRINAGQKVPRPTAFAVVHGHTAKGTSHADCWYPGPAAPLCECAIDECTRRSASWISESRAHRFHPAWPATAPDDADYGTPVSLCLAEDLYTGERPRKLEAVEAYRSQLGFLTRGAPLPERLAGVLDCSGYLISFVRRTEILYLVDPAASPK